jgi:hypothetical protein
MRHTCISRCARGQRWLHTAVAAPAASDMFTLHVATRRDAVVLCKKCSKAKSSEAHPRRPPLVASDDARLSRGRIYCIGRSLRLARPHWRAATGTSSNGELLDSLRGIIFEHGRRKTTLCLCPLSPSAIPPPLLHHRRPRRLCRRPPLVTVVLAAATRVLCLVSRRTPPPGLPGHCRKLGPSHVDGSER